jgi:peroxiredoxin
MSATQPDLSQMAKLTDWDDAAKAIEFLRHSGIHRIFTMNQAPITSFTRAYQLEGMLHLVPSATFLRKSALKVGDKSPDFKLTRLDGQVATKKDFIGRPLVLRFTRAINSKLICPGCTPGLPDLNQSYAEFTKRNIGLAVVLPTSTDNGHQLAEAMELKYPLYCDPTWQIFQDYGTGHGGPLPSQAWAILDAEGVIRWIWRAKARDSKVWTESVPMPMAVLKVVDQLFGGVKA